MVVGFGAMVHLHWNGVINQSSRKGGDKIWQFVGKRHRLINSRWALYLKIGPKSHKVWPEGELCVWLCGCECVHLLYSSSIQYKRRHLLESGQTLIRPRGKTKWVLTRSRLRDQGSLKLGPCLLVPSGSCEVQLCTKLWLRIPKWSREEPSVLEGGEEWEGFADQCSN